MRCVDKYQLCSLCRTLVLMSNDTLRMRKTQTVRDMQYDFTIINTYMYNIDVTYLPAREQR